MTRRIAAKIVAGFAGVGAAFSTVTPVLAQSSSPLSIAPFLNKVNKFILNPIIALMFAVALVFFFWGIFQFVLHNEGDKEREDGKRNMVWGIIGLFIMASVFGIIRLILGTFGLDSPGYISTVL